MENQAEQWQNYNISIFGKLFQKVQAIFHLHGFLLFLCYENDIVNGLQLNGVSDHDFTKSLIIRDFDDVLKNPFRGCNTLPPLNEGRALINPVFCPTSSTNQKHLKLGQCLEIDDMRSLSKFGDVT